MFERWIDKGGIGTAGPDGGVIVKDEELPDVGRVVLEEKIRAERKPLTYYAVTQAVYGWLVHTAYFHDLEDAKEHAVAIKVLMQVAYPKAES